MNNSFSPKREPGNFRDKQPSSGLLMSHSDVVRLARSGSLRYSEAVEKGPWVNAGVKLQGFFPEAYSGGLTLGL